MTEPEESTPREGFTVTERLDGVTLEALKELMRQAR